jgi:hypothetical protein
MLFFKTLLHLGKATDEISGNYLAPALADIFRGRSSLTGVTGVFHKQ